MHARARRLGPGHRAALALVGEAVTPAGGCRNALLNRASGEDYGTLLNPIGVWYSRRTYGEVLDPRQAYGHHARVLFSYVRLEQRAAKWNALDAGLKHLAVMAAAARINCSWCMDFGYWEGRELGLAAEKIEQVPQ
ncbi:carboxymuconolactone decarboxylase family protein [Streptomyces sp. ISL-94]|uniref:carboxymuconolactone decarboxylase family protein n=1 Tax=Streptomyces sp. ISL-94 TaxID=2819190 RepID=UPI0027E4D88A|nr:carboxymuconolactone decarboxylase family protein [Streptomyces sp. ISL-94]